MWVRQCDLDAGSELAPPIPSRIASNEEFVPPPQSDQQKEYEARLAELSERAAGRQGRSRREFLRSGSGMAAAMLAPLAACAQPMPGHHPAYLHALTDLRTARWFLYHQPGDARVYAEEDVAIAEVDAAIGDIKRAAYDDGKNLNDHPAVDVPERGSRLLRAIETLRKAAERFGWEQQP